MSRPRLILSIMPFVLSSCVSENAGEDSDYDEDLSDAWLELQNDDGSADSARCSGVIVPDRGPFGNRIALTFDDGPSLATTPQVLEALAAHRAVGTFFINGRRVTGQDELDLLRSMKEQGHIIANHTTTHPNSTQISLDRFRSEVAGTHEVIETLGVEASRRFFRFPFGAANCDTVDVVQALGYSVTGWHIDTADWCFASATGGVGYCSPSTFRHVPDQYRNDYAGFTLSQARSNGGGVLLMHDVHAFTASHLDGVLTALENAGFQFVGLDDGSTFPALNGAEPGELPWVGTPCDSDPVCSFSYSDREGYCDLSSAYCVMDCNGTCPDRYGHATTFCIASEQGGGICVPKAEAENGNCADIPGTVAEPRDRYVGTSGASAATATVCVPE